MNRLIHIFCIIATITVIILSCSKKSNSRNGEEDTPSTVTTTSGPPSTTGTTGGTTSSGQATGTIVGSPSCTLNPMEVISSNFISSMTLNTAGSQLNSPLYELYNFNSSYFVRLYFTSTMAPATGGYSVVPNNPTSNQVSIRFDPNNGSSYVGNGQSGVVYVTNTGTLVSAVFCNIPCTFQSGGNSYSSVVSARIEK
jgi:hypothetical protein